jgi:hypothetical protein
MFQSYPMKKYVYIALSVCLFYSLQSMAQVLPETKWKVRSLVNFDLIYDASHQEMADLYSLQLEKIAQILHPFFPPRESRTAIVLVDRTDQVNGFATPFPYSMIQIFPVMPGPMDSIGEYSDWTWELLTHEYTHVLAIEPRRGAVSVLKGIFGSIMVPNILLPRWWHEGLAVDTETRFSEGGRLRSTYQDATITALVKDQKWKTVKISEINESTIPTWPYGSRPYLYGSVFWSYLLDKYQKGIMHDLTWNYAGRLPYLLNDSARKYLDSEYEPLFKAALEDTDKKVQSRLSSLRAKKTSQLVSLDLPFTETMSPAISPDGLKLAFISRDETLRRRIQILKRPNLQTAFSKEHLLKAVDYGEGEGLEESVPGIPRREQPDAPPGGSILRLSWFPDSNRLVYDKLEVQSRYEERFELHIYNLSQGRSEKIENVDRAREPSVSPDSKYIAYTYIDSGRASLGLYDTTTGTTQFLFKAALNARVSYPQFLDGENILFSYRKNGKEDLRVFNIKNKTENKFSSTLKQLRFPLVNKNGLFATSSQNGINNIYKIEKNDRTRPLSHSETSLFAFDQDLATGDFYVSEMTSEGIKIFRLPANESQATPIPLPIVKPLYADHYPDYKPQYDLTKSNILKDERDYSPWGYMWPRWWIPSLWSTGRNTYASFVTSGIDPLGKHAYSLYWGWDDETHNGSYAASYLNNSTHFEIPITIMDIKVKRAGSISDNRTRLQAIDFGRQLLFWTPDAKLSLGYTQLTRDQDYLSTKQRGPRLTFNYANYSMSGAMVSPESGWGAWARTTRFLPSTDYLDYNLFEGSLVGYWSKWLPARHAIMAKFSNQYIDREVASANFAATSQLPVSVNSEIPQYLLRGFPAGTLQGRTLSVANLEYRFPLVNTYRGWGVVPIFIRRFHGAIVADAGQTNGFGYNATTVQYQTVPNNLWHYSGGAEVKMDMTIGYHFGFTLFAGAYWPAPNSLNHRDTQYVIGTQL